MSIGRLFAVGIVLAYTTATIAGAAPLRFLLGSTQWSDGWGNRTCETVDHATVFTEPRAPWHGDGYSTPTQRGTERDGANYFGTAPQ